MRSSGSECDHNNNYYLHQQYSFNGQFQDNPGRQVPECQTILDSAAAGYDGSGGGGDNRDAKTCRSHHQHSTLSLYRPDVLPYTTGTAKKTIKELLTIQEFKPFSIIRSNRHSVKQ